jgi:hypothetical protein
MNHKMRPKISIIVYIILGAFLLFLILFSIWILFFPNNIPSVLLQDSSSRIGIAQLSVEIIGLIALGIAIYQFLQSQKRPKLILWLKYENQIPIEKDHEIFVTNLKHNSRLVDDCEHFSGSFHLYLENRGKAATRWIKISLVIMNENNLGQESLLSPPDPNFPEWRKPNSTAVYRNEFMGGENFISYSHPPISSYSSRLADIQDWSEFIGGFSIAIFAENPRVEKKVQLRCYIEASEFPRKEQIFTFRTILPDNSALDRSIKGFQEKLPESVKKSIKEAMESSKRRPNNF